MNTSGIIKKDYGFNKEFLRVDSNGAWVAESITDADSKAY